MVSCNFGGGGGFLLVLDLGFTVVMVVCGYMVVEGCGDAVVAVVERERERGLNKKEGIGVKIKRCDIELVVKMVC